MPLPRFGVVHFLASKCNADEIKAEARKEVYAARRKYFVLAARQVVLGEGRCLLFVPDNQDGGTHHTLLALCVPFADSLSQLGTHRA